MLTCAHVRKRSSGLGQLIWVGARHVARGSLPPEHDEFSGWEEDALDNLTLTVTIGGEEIRLATVTAIPPPACMRPT